MNMLKPSWDDFGSFLVMLRNRIRIELDLREVDRADTVIVGAQRGGLVPAVYLSNHLDIPMISVDFSSTAGRGEKAGTHSNQLPIIRNKTVIIVDDIYDSGKTLSELARFYGGSDNDFKSDLGNKVITAVVYYKPNKDPVLIRPDHYAVGLPSDADEWIVFPFEPDPS